MENILIVGAKRTPVGSFQGTLSQVTGPKLGAAAIAAAVKQAQIGPNDVNEVIMGEVLTAGVGQAPARQAALYAGLPNGVPCLTVNKVCGSGLKAVMLGADSIALGHSQIVVAGGQENMSLAPHLMENSRLGYRMGPVTVVDSMIKDGLWDPYNNFHMGNAAEICVGEYRISREDQDAFALQSYKKAQAALANGSFAQEVTPVTIQDKKGTSEVKIDEEPGRAQLDKIAGLKPAFDKAGTITAANASKINDGGAAVVLMSAKEVKARGAKPLARFVTSATFAHDPKWFTTAPVGAMKRALQNAQLKVSDIDLWEINEAFSVVTMVASREMEIPMDRINVHGGAVAIGHPIGASGARILNTLIYALHTHNKRYGLASLCIGGGEAVAVIIEKV